jgi:hypothetical protein
MGKHERPPKPESVEPLTPKDETSPTQKEMRSWGQNGIKPISPRAKMAIKDLTNWLGTSEGQVFAKYCVMPLLAAHAAKMEERRQQVKEPIGPQKSEIKPKKHVD